MTDAELDALEAKLPSNAVYSDTRGWLAATALDLIASLRESRARIAELERELSSLSLSRFTRSLQRDEAEARIAELKAAIERVKALHFSEPGSGHVKLWCHECSLQCPCPTLAALSTPPEATEPEAQHEG